MRRTRSKLRALALALVGTAILPALGQEIAMPSLPEPRGYFRDSGERANPLESARTLHRERVFLADTAWLRVYFGKGTVLEPGTFVRIRSARDGEVQELDAARLQAWNYGSALFNGDTLDVELVGGPRTTRNRMVIERLGWESLVEGGGGCSSPCAICGTDDRVPSNELWSARIMYVGAFGVCSGSIFSPDSCVVTAAHCTGGTMVLQFNVPPSTAGCVVQQPPVDDQFPVLPGWIASSGGVGNDWSVMRAGENGLGQTPYERYGQLRPIASSPPVAGQTVGAWGYGADPAQCRRHYTQQTHSGPIASVSPTFFNASVDMDCGNSGSGIIRSGQIVGIFTHCGCPSYIQRADDPDFVAARESLCPTCGNGVIDAGEQCDGTAVGEATCADYGCSVGAVACTASCTLDYTACGCCDGVIAPSDSHGSFTNAKAASDGNEATFAAGSYGGSGSETVEHQWSFPLLGVMDGELKAVISNDDPVGLDSSIEVSYVLLHGGGSGTVGSTTESTPATFTVNLTDADLSTLQLNAIGTADGPPPFPAGTARVHELLFTAVSSPSCECSIDEHCDDDLFCTTNEHCDDDVCVSESPCPAGKFCAEDINACLDPCPNTYDCDSIPPGSCGPSMFPPYCPHHSTGMTACWNGATVQCDPGETIHIRNCPCEPNLPGAICTVQTQSYFCD